MRRVILPLLLASAAAHADPAPGPAPGPASGPAPEQPPDIVVTRRVGRADVGRFLRDKDNEPIGSVWGVYGDTAVVMLGFAWGPPGSHLVTVPLGELRSQDGGITADEAALRARPEYKPRCADLLCFSTLPPEPPTVAR